ncbi:MAG: helix-turn-helix domain-containing protein [Actinomycetota bacterium]|nr:helix-turn-helix domain-containing protein [Actinomycetota bacterium]
MASDLQLLIDHLAEEVGSSVVLEDHEQRTLAHSSQLGVIDELRRDSILHRATPPEIIAWLRGLGIASATGPVLVPGHAEGAILPRVCAPARYRDRLLGFVWVIDGDGAVAANHLPAIAKTAEHAAVLLYEEQLAQRLMGQVLSHLLSPSEELRAAAAQQIADQALFTSGQPVAAVVIQPIAAGGGLDPGLVLEQGLTDVGWEAPAGSLLRLALSDHAVLLVRLRGGDDAVLELAGAAQAACARRLQAAGGAPVRVVAAIGDACAELPHVVASYRQARLAAKVAAAIPSTGDLVRWSELGVFRALAQLPTREAQEAALDPRVCALLEIGEAALVDTVETFLDLAGDVKAASEALHLHRGTLYYRLAKAERLTGVDFSNGYDRLTVHLGLKLARLTGRSAGVP